MFLLPEGGCVECPFGGSGKNRYLCSMPTPPDKAMQKRAFWHDYRSRQIYMLTFRRCPEAPELSRIQEWPTGLVTAEPSEAGKTVASHIALIDHFHPSLQNWKYVIMPDHVHFLLFVKETLPEPVGVYLWAFVKAVNEQWGSPLLEAEYHDRIVFAEGTAARLKAYIQDNPRRCLMKKRHPDRVSTRYRVRIGEAEFEVVGNVFLLESPAIEAVRVSSKYTPEELTGRKRRWLEAIRGGGVLASPFISPKERDVMGYAIENGGRLILLADNGFAPLYKPPGVFFDLCFEGRAAILAPLEYRTRRQPLTRARALELNALAEAIAKGEARLLF